MVRISRQLEIRLVRFVFDVCFIVRTLFLLVPEAGYEHRFFVGLLSEHLVYKEHNKNPWVWEKIPGHERNEALDCRNYAQAAFTALAPDMDALLRKASGNTSEPPKATGRAKSAPKRANPMQQMEQRMNELLDW